MRRLWIPIFWLAIFIVAVLVMHFRFSVNLYAALGFGIIGLIAIFINGLIATWEDDQPGGFNNPTPEKVKSGLFSFVFGAVITGILAAIGIGLFLHLCFGFDFYQTIESLFYAFRR